MDPFDGDAHFSALVFATLDESRSALRARRSGPLIPFATVLAPEGRETTRFAGTNYDEDQAAALTFARSGGFAAWAVAWDGYLTMSGERTDAILVRAARAGARNELLFAWRYERGEAGELRTLGNPAFLGPAR